MPPTPQKPERQGNDTTVKRPKRFVRFITVKGKRLDAHDYGHKAWPLH